MTSKLINKKKAKLTAQQKDPPPRQRTYQKRNAEIARIQTSIAALQARQKILQKENARLEQALKKAQLLAALAR